MEIRPEFGSVALQEAHGWAQKALSLTAKYTKVLAWLFVGAIGLGALPAFAQEAAPSVQAENWVQALLGIVVTGVILPLARELFGVLKAKAEGTRYSGAVNAVSSLVESRVAWIQMRVQEAASDGKVTKEEWQAIAKDLVTQLPAETLEVLRKHLGAGVVEWVAGMLLDRFTARARADSAAAAAVAAVPNADAAMASRRAMAAE